MIIDPATLAYLAARGRVAFRWLFWIEARNRSTGLTETVGFWNGADDRSFQVGGLSRQYIGMGDVLRVPSITHEPGPVVRMQSIEFGAFSGALEQAIAGYDARQAPCDLHLAFFDPDTTELVSVNPVCRGWLDRAPARYGPVNSPSGVRVTVAGSSRRLTQTLPLKKSNEAQSGRAHATGQDLFRRYASVSGSVSVWWGEARSDPNGSDKKKEFGPLNEPVR